MSSCELGGGDTIQPIAIMFHGKARRTRRSASGPITSPWKGTGDRCVNKTTCSAAAVLCSPGWQDRLGRNLACQDSHVGEGQTPKSPGGSAHCRNQGELMIVLTTKGKRAAPGGLSCKVSRKWLLEHGIWKDTIDWVANKGKVLYT